MTVLVAKFEGKNKVSLRVGGHGTEHVGQTVPAKTKDGRTLYVRLVKVLEDYGDDDVAVFESTFK